MEMFECYMPNFVAYEIQLLIWQSGDWYPEGYSSNDLVFTIAYAQKLARKKPSTAWRIVKKDLRQSPIEPNEDVEHLKPSVIWVSRPTFKGMEDYWRI